MFVVVGDGPERKNLEFRIQNLGLPRYVQVVGPVPQRDIVPYFRAADIFLLPSEEEGFPHVLLEAMAAGLPYVASDVGGVSEITPPVLQPFLVPPAEVVRFAAKVVSLLAMPPGGRAAIGADIRSGVARYDIGVVRAAFMELFR